MATKIQLRRGSASQWTAANPVLSIGEMGVETDTGKYKIGTGNASWMSLPYGTRGDTGAQGPQGIQGPAGSPGTPGSAGAKGDKGDTGLQGLQGLQGIQGEPGPQGERGYTGAKGDQGDQGVQGEQGPIGLTGFQGPKGDTGDTGAKGDPGDPGADGTNGTDGTNGADGAPGAKGDTGNTGLKGDTGDQGIQGIQGVPGTPGAKGDTGDQGIQGNQGIQGIQGPAGVANYTIAVQALTSSPTDSQTVYFGMLPKAPTTTANISKIYIRKAGAIKGAEIYCYSGTAGTAEAWSLYIRKNNTTDTLIQTLSVSASERVFTNTALNIAVAVNDYIEIKGVQPLWATNPLTTIWGGYIYLES